MIARNRAVAEGRRWKPKPCPLTDEERFEPDFPFAARDRRREQAAAEHRARRRAVEAEVASQDRLHRSLRDQFGIEATDRFFAGASYAEAFGGDAA